MRQPSDILVVVVGVGAVTVLGKSLWVVGPGSSLVVLSSFGVSLGPSFSGKVIVAGALDLFGWLITVELVWPPGAPLVGDSFVRFSQGFSSLSAFLGASLFPGGSKRRLLTCRIFGVL